MSRPEERIVATTQEILDIASVYQQPLESLLDRAQEHGRELHHRSMQRMAVRSMQRDNKRLSDLEKKIAENNSKLELKRMEYEHALSMKRLEIEELKTQLKLKGR